MTHRPPKFIAFLSLACVGLLSSPAFGQAIPGSEGDNGPAFQPSVTAVMPKAGPVGTKVTMKGTNLSGVTAVLFPPNIEVKVKAKNSYTIQVTVPPGAQSGPVLLETPEGISNRNPVFNVQTAP